MKRKLNTSAKYKYRMEVFKMKDFVFDMPTRVLFGAGQLGALHEQKLPGKRR